MSCLSWNCCGLGNPCVVQELANLVRAKDPLAVFLIETWSKSEYLEIILCHLHFNNKFVVPSNNKGGGLALFWNNSMNLTIKSFSCHHIDTVINEGQEDAWRLTGIYGAPKTHKRSDMWTFLNRLSHLYQLPWCVIGDFNEIVRLEEMRGPRPRPDRQMRAFHEALDHSGLIDLRYVRPHFTWCNNYDPPHTTWVRLDRAVATTNWLNRFPIAWVDHVEVTNSDHRCLWLQCNPLGSFRYRWKPFRFEEMWMNDSGCEETIQGIWNQNPRGIAMYKVATKLKDCKKQLGVWSRRCFSSLRRQLAEKKRQLCKAEVSAMNGGDLGRLKAMRVEVNCLL